MIWLTLIYFDDPNLAKSYLRQWETIQLFLNKLAL